MEHKEIKGSLFYYERGPYGKKRLASEPNPKQLFIRHMIQQRTFIDHDGSKLDPERDPENASGDY